MKHIKPLRPLETLKKYLKYDPDTGLLSWQEGLTYGKQRPAGTPAGTMYKGGYLRTSIERQMYAVHRIAWKMHYGSGPDGVIDHIDGDKLNNRIAKLRDVTQTENLYNTVRRSDNTTGYKGVVFDKAKNKYAINLKVNGVRVSSRRFETPEAANDFLVSLRKSTLGEFAFHGERKAA